MDKKVLLAVDGSVNALDAVTYAARMGERIGDLNFSLMAIQPALSQYLLDEAQIKSQARMALEKAIEANKARANEILIQAAERLVLKGVAESRIDRLTKPRDMGVAKDLLVTAEAKPYDAVLVGRRGSSYLREWVLGSVTANLLAHTREIPIWVVDGEVTSSDVLLAADGSTSALRALDHMAFILAAEENPKLHVLHVRPRFQDYCEIDLEAASAQNAHEAILEKDHRCMDDFHHQAITVLQKYRFDEKALEIARLDGRMSVARSVVRYAADHKFGTIVLGRSGMGKNPFTGSVSGSILNKTKDMALWMVP